MDLKYLLIQLMIAIGCAVVAGILVPRQIPGKGVGLVLIGLLGVFIGQWAADYLLRQYGLSWPILTWELEDVAIVPSIIGSTVVLYLVSAFLSWGRYGNR